jgi:hypothetical protein
MRRWGRVLICKASRPDHELGIQTNATFLRKVRKEVIQRGQRQTCKKQSREKNLEKRREHVFVTLELREKLRSKLIFGCKNP